MAFYRLYPLAPLPREHVDANLLKQPSRYEYRSYTVPWRSVMLLSVHGIIYMCGDCIYDSGVWIDWAIAGVSTISPFT